MPKLKIESAAIMPACFPCPGDNLPCIDRVPDMNVDILVVTIQREITVAMLDQNNQPIAGYPTDIDHASPGTGMNGRPFGCANPQPLPMKPAIIFRAMEAGKNRAAYLPRQPPPELVPSLWPSMEMSHSGWVLGLCAAGCR